MRKTFKITQKTNKYTFILEFEVIIGLFELASILTRGLWRISQ